MDNIKIEGNQSLCAQNHCSQQKATKPQVFLLLGGILSKPWFLIVFELETMVLTTQALISFVFVFFYKVLEVWALVSQEIDISRPGPKIVGIF